MNITPNLFEREIMRKKNATIEGAAETLTTMEGWLHDIHGELETIGKATAPLGDTLADLSDSIDDATAEIRRQREATERVEALLRRLIDVFVPKVEEARTDVERG